MQPEAEKPAVEETEEPQVEDTFDDGKFNPDELAPELQPGWKQLQAAFTRKTQEHAAKLRQVEELGGLESIQQAVDLVQRIQDPSNWAQMYNELEEALRQAGQLPQREDPRPEQPTPQATPEFDDPDLAPLHEKLQALEKQLSTFQGEREQALAREREEMEQQRALQAYMGELTRQEEAIREANPNYAQEDIDAIYDLAPAFGGNLLQAAERYEAVVGRRVEAYFAQKKAGASAATAPPPVAPIIPPRGKEPQTMEEAAAEAEEILRQLQAAGELDLSGF